MKHLAEPVRVLHCPTQVGGNPFRLARAERQIGLDSWSVSYSFNYLNYQTDEIVSTNRLLYEIKRWGLLKRLLSYYDIVHFNFGQTTMPQQIHGTGFSPLQHILISFYNFYASRLELQDLPIIKRAGIGIAVTFQGDDARQGGFMKNNFEINPCEEVAPGYYSQQSDQYKRKRIAKFSEYADLIYALNPDLLYLLPERTKFLPYAAVDLNRFKVVDSGKLKNHAPLIVHAPTDRGIKGTRFLLQAISRLQTDGVPLEFILVEDLSHEKAMEIYKKADILVDQLLLGWYGGLSVELMAMGKPVVCYIRSEDLKFIPRQMKDELPIINATPASIYQVLKSLLAEHPDRLLEIGRRSRNYVERWHDPLKIALGLEKDYASILNRHSNTQPSAD